MPDDSQPPFSARHDERGRIQLGPHGLADNYYQSDYDHTDPVNPDGATLGWSGAIVIFVAAVMALAGLVIWFVNRHRA